MKRKIAIDLTRLLTRSMKGRLPTGVDRVSLAYVRHFCDQACAVVRLGGLGRVMSASHSREVFSTLLSGEAIGRRQMLALLARASLGSRPAGHLRDHFVINTGHSGLDAAGYARRLVAQQARPLLMVHDLIPITHPEYCRKNERFRHIARMDTVLATASGVITNSTATLDELARYAASRGRTLPPAIAAPLAPASLPPPAAQRLLKEPYFVVLSTIEPRKNHSMLLQVWRTLAARMGERVPRLVIIGQRGWESTQTVALLERCESFRGVVIEHGVCGDQELSTYLHHAQALLFPSFAEGYGLPLMESLATGVPVIASDLPAFREIAGDIPDYLDPLDGLGWMRAIENYIAPQSTSRRDQCIRLNGFKAPTWGTHFDKVEEFMCTLM
ncbi:MAG: glycosyltransferase family 4 protein [Massilia sp.]